MAKILLVEDDNNLREIYEARMQAEGYTIVSAKDGEEALAVAKAEKPDLIVSDIMMPKLSGLEMLDIIKNTDGLHNVKIIMLTALGQADDQQRADKLGADKYLVKSQVTLEDIVKAANDLLSEQATNSTPANTAPSASPAIDPTAQNASASAGTVPSDQGGASTSNASNPPGASAQTNIQDGVNQSSAAAQPAVQEEAKVNAQIEHYVAGADPATETKTEQQASNDKVLENAVSSLYTPADDAEGQAATPTESGEGTSETGQDKSPPDSTGNIAL